MKKSNKRSWPYAEVHQNSCNGPKSWILSTSQLVCVHAEFEVWRWRENRLTMTDCGCLLQHARVIQLPLTAPKKMAWSPFSKTFEILAPRRSRSYAKSLKLWQRKCTPALLPLELTHSKCYQPLLINFLLGASQLSGNAFLFAICEHSALLSIPSYSHNEDNQSFKIHHASILGFQSSCIPVSNSSF